jgi:excisionase family DNA binding protein
MFDSSAATQTYFDVRSTAARLGVRDFTLRRMVAMRQIEHMRLGSGAGRVLFTEAQINDYLQRRTVSAAQAA